MVIFESVRFKNLLASGNYWTEIKFNINQNTLIVGTNGSGKSTLLDALCFGLFGKAFRNINKPLLLNSINKKECLVEVKFSTNNRNYKVVRGIKPNIFQIYVDDVLIDQEAAMKDYQEILEKSILKFNYKSFTQIVILGSASFVPFMQLSTSDRRSIIEDLLDIHIFSTMNTVAKDRVTNNKDIINVKKNEIQLSEQKYQIEKKHLESIREDNNEKILSYQSDISNAMEQNGILLNEIEQLQVISEKLQKIIENKPTIDESLKKLTRIEMTGETKLKQNKQEKNFLESNDTCPTCKQDIDSTFKGTKISKLNGNINELQTGLQRLEVKILEEQKKLNCIVEKQKDLQKVHLKIASNQSAINEANKYAVRLQKEIDKLLEKKSNSDDDTELSNLAEGLKVLQKELKKLLDDRVYLDLAILLLKDSGIKTKIIKQYLPIINKLVNKYLAALDFFVNFNLDESFKETIKSRHRDDFTYNNFSEGEKTKINLSIMFAWREVAKIKNSAHTNLLILDEIFDSSLDDSGIDYLLKILHSMEDINIHIISHKGDILQDKFERVLSFSKVKNFSKMRVL